MNDKTTPKTADEKDRRDPPSRVRYSSPVCYAAELDPAYFGVLDEATADGDGLQDEASPPESRDAPQRPRASR